MTSLSRYGALCAACLSLTLVGCGGSSDSDSGSGNRSKVVYVKTSAPRSADGSAASIIPSEMYTINSDGSARTRVGDTGEAVYYFSPKLSQDGSKIVVLSSRDNCGGEGCKINAQGIPTPLQVWVMNADGRQAKRLTHIRAVDPSEQHLSYPALSSDGSKVVYADKAGLTVMDVNSLQETTFGKEQFNFPYSSPTFSPDGTKIAYSYDGGIYTVNTDGTGKTKIVERGFASSFSPDGSQITYVENLSETRSQGIFYPSSINIANADGTGQIRLISNYNAKLSPSFSKDGKTILFKQSINGYIQSISESIPGPVRIITMNIDGSNHTSFDTDGQ